MMYKKYFVLLTIFIAYIFIMNYFGNVAIVYQMFYTNYPSASNTASLTLSPAVEHSLTVVVKRARQFCLFGHCLLPTYIYLPLKLDGLNLYVLQEPVEYRIKSINFWFMVSMVSLLTFFVITDIGKYLNTCKHNYFL